MDSQTRQEMVRAAVVFLQNPKLLDSSLKDKLKFLKDKGLSEIEVDEALNLALVNRQQSTGGRWNFTIILGLCIMGYKLYQSYLESKKNMTVQSKQTQLKPLVEHSTSQLTNDILSKDQHTLAEILQKMTELKKLIELQRTNFGTEIQSLKTLLLGHEKFAAPPVIPAWQLGESGEAKDDKSNLGKEPERKETQKAPKKKIDKGKKVSNNEVRQPTIGNGFNESVIAPTLE